MEFDYIILTERGNAVSKRRSKEETLQNYRNMPEVNFVGDKRRKIYHEHGCPEIVKVSKADLYHCGPFPESFGFSRCQRCKPKPPEGVAKKKKGKTKADIMKQSLTELANRHGMHVAFVGNNIMVTTIAGEWYFDYNVRPIRLHHKNNQQRTDSFGRSTGHYHRQNISLETPLEAMAYIYRHERAAEQYAFFPDHKEEPLEPSEHHGLIDDIPEDNSSLE